MLGVLAGMLLALLAVLLLRGPERVHFFMDRQGGARARLRARRAAARSGSNARFTTPEAVERLAAGG